MHSWYILCYLQIFVFGFWLFSACSLAICSRIRGSWVWGKKTLSSDNTARSYHLRCVPHVDQMFVKLRAWMCGTFSSLFKIVRMWLPTNCGEDEVQELITISYNRKYWGPRLLLQLDFIVQECRLNKNHHAKHCYLFRVLPYCQYFAV